MRRKTALDCYGIVHIQWTICKTFEYSIIFNLIISWINQNCSFQEIIWIKIPNKHLNSNLYLQYHKREKLCITWYQPIRLVRVYYNQHCVAALKRLIQVLPMLEGQNEIVCGLQMSKYNNIIRYNINRYQTKILCFSQMADTTIAHVGQNEIVDNLQISTTLILSKVRFWLAFAFIQCRGGVADCPVMYLVQCTWMLAISSVGWSTTEGVVLAGKKRRCQME